MNGRQAASQYFTFRAAAEGFREDRLYRGMHPMMASGWSCGGSRTSTSSACRRSRTSTSSRAWRARTRRTSGCSRVAEVRDVDARARRVRPRWCRSRTSSGCSWSRWPRSGASRAAGRPEERLHWNRVLLYVWPPLDVTPRRARGDRARKLGPRPRGSGSRRCVVRAPHARRPDAASAATRCSRISQPGAAAALVSASSRRRDEPIRPLSEYGQKVDAHAPARARRIPTSSCEL